MAKAVKKKEAPTKKVVSLPKRYKPSDVMNIIDMAKRGKNGSDMAKMYKVTVESFKKSVYVFRKIGYVIPNIRYNKRTEKPLKKDVAPKPDPKKMQTRVVDDSKMKWVRVNNRTMIQVKKEENEQKAIDQYYAKRERDNQFLSRIIKAV